MRPWSMYRLCSRRPMFGLMKVIFKASPCDPMESFCLPLLDHELISQQVGRIAFNAFQPLLHHDHGYTGSRGAVFVWLSEQWRCWVFFTRTGSRLIKLVHGLTGDGLFLGDLFGGAARTDWLVCQAAGLLPVPIVARIRGVISTAPFSTSVV